MAETADEPVEPIKQKICILKASIHCEGCKRKVKKILSQLQGVEFVDVDTKQQKVTVVGNVDADTLIKKLAKSGKKAELWPQKAEKREKIHGNGNGKEKEIEKTQKKVDLQEANQASHNGKTPETSMKVEVANKNSEGSGDSVKAGDGGSAQTNGESGGAGGGGAGGAAAKAVSVKTTSDVQETKKEEKKSEESCSATAEPPQTAERKVAVEKNNGGGGGGGGGESGTSGKKKKKKGQSGNLDAPSAAAPPAHRESENQEPGPPHPTNQSPPRNHFYPPPHSYYTPPPPPQPVYAVSYNTAYPTSSYTASYYAAPPPYSYAYMHPGPVTEPPPSDPDLNPRQPLDSFEIFSDENPNGCFIM